jgi:hypothetical protein
MNAVASPRSNSLLSYVFTPNHERYEGVRRRLLTRKAG